MTPARRGSFRAFVAIACGVIAALVLCEVGVRFALSRCGASLARTLRKPSPFADGRSDEDDGKPQTLLAPRDRRSRSARR